MNTLVLDSTTKSIEIRTVSAPQTTNPSFIASYADNDGTNFAEKSSDGVLNGTTPVTAISSPATGTRRIIKGLSVNNIDTAALQVIVQLNNGGTIRQIYKQTLSVGDTFTLDGTLDVNGNTKVTFGTGGGGTTDVGAMIVAATAKTTFADTDTFAGINSESGDILTKWTWANIRSALWSGVVTVAQTAGQTIGSTGSRLTKLWATDITVTNPITGSVSGSSGKTSNLIGGNSTTQKGTIPYQSDIDTTVLLSPNTSTTKKFLRETGTGTNGNAPAWDTVTAADVGLGSAENTTDADKPISTATQNALNAKLSATGVTGATAKSTIVDADSLTGVNSESGSVITRWTWANIKTFLGSVFAASSHAHGNITTDGKIGSTATIPIITGTAGILQAGSFGTAAGSFCQGNDSRLSDVRTPTDNSATYAKQGSEFKDDLAITANAIDWASGTYKAITLSANTTFTFTNIEKQKIIHLKITGAYTITWPTGCIIINGGTYTGAKQNNIYIECVATSTPEFKISILTEP